jgi:hypothetical protein
MAVYKCAVDRQQLSIVSAGVALTPTQEPSPHHRVKIPDLVVG